jgi:WD40 repeat protein
MKKLISGLILIAILITACTAPSATGPVERTVTGATGDTLQPVAEVTPTLHVTVTPGTIIPQPISRNNFSELANNINYTAKIGELAGKSYAELAISIVAYSPDGRYVAFGGCTELWSGHCQNDVFGSSDSFIYVLDAVTAELVSDVPEKKTTISGLSFSRDGNKLAYATSPFKVAVWDIPSGTTDIVFSQEKDGSSYGKVAFSPNSDSVAFVFDEYLYVWSYPEGKLLTKSPAFWYAVDFPQFSADGKKLAVYTQNYGRELSIYDTGTWRIITRIVMPGNGAHRAAFSADGRLVASAEEAENADVYLWDADTGKQIGQLDVSLVNVTAMGFTPDSKLLFITGYPTDIFETESYSIWDMTEQKHLGGLIAENEASRIYFSEDGMTFFDGLSLWGAPDKALLAARQVMKDYLLALNTGDYETAAGLFLTEDYVLKWYSDAGYDTSDIPLMLQAVCAAPEQLCMTLDTVMYSGISYYDMYLFMVQFKKPDGSMYISEDGYRNIWVNVSRDADGNFKVSGYPI